MKNGTLRFIPLQSDLCLNKQKVDISDFKGWQKCNAPVYGDCLSPLYKKDDTHHDIFLGSDTYDFSEGKLYKNGTEVLSGAGSKKIKKTLFNKDYTGFDIENNGDMVWHRETSNNTIKISLDATLSSEGNPFDVTIANCTKIVASKSVCRGANFRAVVVMYLHTSGKYGYYVTWIYNDNRYSAYGQSSQNPTLWDNFEVVSPLIQVGVYGSGNTALISFFGTSGTTTSTQIKNVVIQETSVYDDPTFKDTSLTTTRYQLLDQEVPVSIGYYTWSVGNGNVYAQKQKLYMWIRPHKAPIRVTFWTAKPTAFSAGLGRINATDFEYVKAESMLFPANDNNYELERNIAYEATGLDENATLRWKQETITTIGTTTTTEEGEGTGLATPLANDPTDATNIKTYPCYKRKGNVAQSMIYVTINVGQLQSADDPTVAPSYTTPRVPTTYFDGEAGLYLDGGIASPTNYMDWGQGGATPLGYVWNESPDIPMSDYSYGYRGGAIIYNHRTVDQYITTVPFMYDNSGLLPNQDGTGAYSFYGNRGQFPEQYKVAFTNNSLAEVNCCLDDNKLYYIGSLGSTETELPTKQLSLAGTYSTFVTGTSVKEIRYGSDATLDFSYMQDENNVYPKYYAGATFNIQNHYLRIIYFFKAKKDDTEFINILVDSLALGEGNPPTYLLGGVTKDSNNTQGGIKNTTTTEGWRLLFNNNIISNIACYENKKYIGTILADWLTIDDTFCITYNTNHLFYRDNQRRIWHLEMVTSQEEWQYKLIENRYIVLNTTNYFNCYDTQTGLKRHWASDYNNRVLYGLAFTLYQVSPSYTDFLTRERFRGLIATAQNANYEMTQDTISGLELGAVYISACLVDKMTFISCDTPYGATEGIDLYRGDDDSTSAKYICSYQNSLKYIDTDLTNPDAVYPIADGGDVRYNPNLFTQFITSYNNKDMVISDGVAYKLVYYNNVTPIMAYYLLDGVESLENAFVLQSTFYGVSKTRLYQMNYSYGVGVEVVCDITNMEYLGALPTQALFWSAQNRAIYSFKGSCIMQLTQYANDLTGIYGKWYNPATQELFLDTNIGILVFSDLGTYCLEWETETNTKSVRDIFFFEDYFIINLIADVTESHYYSYNNKTGYESNKVYFITKYYGNGLVPITVNNIYIRLYDQAVENAEGFIKMKGYTITDKGTQTDTKEVLIGGEDNPEATPPTVAGEAWDSETGTMLVKYTPQYNRGLGFALEVETTFPIIDIKFDYVENGTIESQIAHVNI